MKSSPYRKRYILVYSERLNADLKAVEKTLQRTFRAKRKHVSGNYCIFRTNQYHKDQVIEYINNEIPGFKTMLTSGTIKKCKDRIAESEEVPLVNAKQ